MSGKLPYLVENFLSPWIETMLDTAYESKLQRPKNENLLLKYLFFIKVCIQNKQILEFT